MFCIELLSSLYSLFYIFNLECLFTYSLFYILGSSLSLVFYFSSFNLFIFNCWLFSISYFCILNLTRLRLNVVKFNRWMSLCFSLLFFSLISINGLTLIRLIKYYVSFAILYLYIFNLLCFFLSGIYLILQLLSAFNSYFNIYSLCYLILITSWLVFHFFYSFIVLIFL